VPFIGGGVELGRWRLQSRRLRLRLGVNNNSGKLVAEETAALKRQQRGRFGRREGCSEVGLGSGRHGVASAGDEAAQRRRDASGRRRCRAVLCGRQRRAEARRVLATCCCACGEDGVAARGAGLQRRELGRGAVRPSTRAGGSAVWSTRARGTARQAACCVRARGSWRVCVDARRRSGVGVLTRVGGAGLARRPAAVVRRGRRGGEVRTGGVVRSAPW